MAQLWGGRFTKETDKLVYNFNASISFDKKLYKQDIEGSIAHVTMLGAQGILTKQEMEDIIRTLNEIREDVEAGRLEITDDTRISTALWRQILLTDWEIPVKSCIPEGAETIRWLWICVSIREMRYWKPMCFYMIF